MSGAKSLNVPGPWPTVDVPLTPEDEAMMLVIGFAFRAPDGILTVTDKGSSFIRDWCRRRVEAEARDDCR